MPRWISWSTASEEASKTKWVLEMVKDWVSKACSCTFLKKPFDIHSDAK
jgi:hypothetical protein